MDDSSSRSRSRSPGVANRLGPVDVLVLSAWCGLAAGELEVAARIVHRAFSSTASALSDDPALRLAGPADQPGAVPRRLGCCWSWRCELWPRRAGWLGPRLIIALAVLPALMVAGRRIYPEAWLLVALGVAFRVAPVLERHPAGGAAVCRAERSRSFWGWSCFQAGWVCRRRPDQAVARRGPPLASGRLAERALDRAGYRAGGPPEPLRLSTAHVPFFGAAGPARDSLRPGSSRGALDPRIAREHVHRPVAA